MREAHPIEREIGIAWYASDHDGTGGRLKDNLEDFRVTEIEEIDVEPLTADPDAYPHLIVRATLTGWDTFDFARQLGGEIGVHEGAIDWAGTKDKRAVSTQLFSIKGVDPDELPAIPHATLEPVGRFGRQLTHGDLRGNTFTIRVREATTPAHASTITDELSAFGDGRIAVPNFFGHQRFGSRRPITHAVGLAIVRGDWERAVMQYLGAPSDREPEATQAARTFIEETRDWEEALERMPGGLGHERRLLGALADGASFEEALETFPRQLQRLFVHAAQSYLFNRIVSERHRREVPLTEAVPGDTVCFASTDATLGPIPDPDRRQRVDEARLETVNRHVTNGRAFVTAPLIGTETALGEGEMADIARDVLAEEDLATSDFDLPEPYGSTGTVRATLVHPSVEIDREPLTFSFGLPSGAYATVVLREYMKVDPDAMD